MPEKPSSTCLIQTRLYTLQEHFLIQMRPCTLQEHLFKLIMEEVNILVTTEMEGMYWALCEDSI